MRAAVGAAAREDVDELEVGEGRDHREEDDARA
jgi:hypothetical protein